MLGELEEAQQRLTVRERETKSALEHMVRDRDQLREELHGLRAERKRLLHEAYAQAAQTVENTRRQMERLLREVERSVASPARKQVSAQARDEVQTRQAKIEQALIETAARPRVPIRPAALRRGQKVWVEKLRANGRIVSLSPGQDLATVQVGGIRFSVALREIGEPDAGQTPAETSEAKLSMPRPQAAVASELNLVGNRVDVALGRLDTFLDQALLAKLPEVRVIHGFGTGRLREAVHACLREHPAACRFRLGRQGQDPGGAGATIVRLAEPAPR
jgi:DNA mismatch repair protein MutS2